MRGEAYFTTEESEKAAKWEVVERYKKAAERLSALGSRCRSVGENISTLGRAISESANEVEFNSQSVLFPKYNKKNSPVHSMPLADLDPEMLRALVEDVKETYAERTEALRMLREMGIDPEPNSKGL